MPEDLVQRFWRERDFAQGGLRVRDGRALVVRDPGRWNLLGGPDFRGAELVLGGLPVVGDVEVHFRAADWRAHGHDRDPAYDAVVLHVLLFPPRTGEVRARTHSGREPAELVLLPRLHQDLEAHLLDDALRRRSGCDPADWLRPVLALSDSEREQRIAEAGWARWRQRLYWTGERLDAVGWEEACHQRLFEVLGYAANRPAMASLAWRHPFSEWSSGPGPEVDTWMAEEAVRWVREGLRPANQPRRRLAQLRHIWEVRRDWPHQLRRLGARLPVGEGMPGDIRAWRQQERLAHWRREFSDLLAGAIPAPRLDTLVTEAFLPLLGAADGHQLGSLWWAWPPGDRPRSWHEVMRLIGRTPRGQPATHGRWQAAGALVAEARHSGNGGH